MPKTKVVIVRGQNPFDIVDKALELIDIEKLICEFLRSLYQL